MSTDIQNWRSFQLQDLFEIKYGVNLALNACIESDGPDAVNFVSRTELNNGVSAKIAPVPGVKPQESGLITVAAGGSVLSTFIQPEPFYSGRDLYVLKPRNEDAGLAVKMFLVTVIEANKFKFSYGRQANKSLPFIEVKLPVRTDSNGAAIIDSACPYGPDGYVPDWQFMEDFIKGLNHKPLTTSNARPALKLDHVTWAKFKIGDFFEIRPTKAYKGLSADDLDDGGKTPFVVNSSVNNGIGGLCTLPPTEDGNKITFSDTTDGNTFFYQSEPFIGFSHVQGMYAKDVHIWTQEELLFLTTILTFDSVGRYNYGRKMTRETIKSREVLLPVAPDGEPDWQFMENYIRSLPFGDRIPEVGD